MPRSLGLMDSLTGGGDLQKQIDELEGEIRDADRSMNIMRTNRSAYIDDIVNSVDGIDSSLANMKEKLMMKINSIKAIINKFDTENSIPDADSLG